MKNNILSTLTKEEQKLVQVKTAKSGEFLYREGELCSNISIVVSGQVKISSMTYSGNELVFNILEKDEIFGNNLIFSDSPYYKGDVKTTKDSVIVNISKENLTTILQSNKNFLLMYLKIQSNFGKKLNSTIKMLSFSSIEERFMYYLHEQKDEIKFRSITDLSDILHVSREALSRLLTKLEKENAIKRSPHLITKIN